LCLLSPIFHLPTPPSSRLTALNRGQSRLIAPKKDEPQHPHFRFPLSAFRFLLSAFSPRTHSHRFEASGT
jgi:hypothetical protein